MMAILLLSLAFTGFLYYPRQSHAQESANSQFIAGYKYSHITTAANNQLKGAAGVPASGVLHTIVINSATAVGVVTVVDTNVAACTGGTTIAVIAAAVPAQSLYYDVQFVNGLCITNASTDDITVSYR
jgi:hypothetical protein